jgi:hypothetical protein
MSITTINTRPRPRYDPYWKPGGAGTKYQGIARFKVDEGPYRQATHEIQYQDRTKHNYVGFPVVGPAPGMSTYQAKAVLIHDNMIADPQRRIPPHGARSNMIVGATMLGDEEYTPTYSGLVPTWFKNFFDRSKGPNPAEELWKKSQQPYYVHGPTNKVPTKTSESAVAEPGPIPQNPLKELPQFPGQMPIETAKNYPMIPTSGTTAFKPKETSAVMSKELMDPSTIYGQPKGIAATQNIFSSHVR